MILFIGGVFVGMALVFIGLCLVAVLGGTKCDEPCRMPEASQAPFEQQ